MRDFVLDKLKTEVRNERTLNLDEMPISEFLTVMNEEDAKVAQAVSKQIPNITKAVETIITSFKKGGRLIYLGAGTSGRIGLLDSVECPPTFGVDFTQVVGLIAGGENAFIKAVEGAEDSKSFGVEDLKEINLTANDTVVGIAASGRTPYVIGGLEYANEVGAETIAVSCNTDAEISKYANLAIEVDNGPEVLTGSTRLKSGTSQKLICNMLSTASMVGVGKVFGNLMVDVQLTNEKLVDRAKRIVQQATECDCGTASKYLSLADNRPKIAIVMILTGASKEEAVQKLEENEGFVRKAVE